MQVMMQEIMLVQMMIQATGDGDVCDSHFQMWITWAWTTQNVVKSMVKYLKNKIFVTCKTTTKTNEMLNEPKKWRLAIHMCVKATYNCLVKNFKEKCQTFY